MAQPIWNTSAGVLGTYVSGNYVGTTVSASPVLPAVSVTYSLISGSLPSGLNFQLDGLIYGTPNLVTTDTTSTFTIRATDNLGNLRDRTFSMIISGSALPELTTPAGSLLSTFDSVWVQLPITYNNPDPNNPVTIRVLEGSLPPGLEINEYGLIRGYANPPISNITLPSVITEVTVTETSNVLTCISTTGFSLGRPVVFSGVTLFGGIEADTTYYIKSIINNTSFTLSATQNGPTLSLTSGVGFMTATLPSVSVGQPTIRTFSFSLILESPLGGDTALYSITVINQNTPVSQGGPGRPNNTRIPTVYNTRPATYQLHNNDPYYGYYLLPTNGNGYTYPTTQSAFIGSFESDNYFAFKIIGHDFDGNQLTYAYVGLPPGLTGDPNTGWITGTPVIASRGVNQYNFGAAVFKTGASNIQSAFFNFSFNVTNNITGDIYWITPNNLGTILNDTISTKSVLAYSEEDVTLSYRIVQGTLPPNLTLLDNGEITGYVAMQPTVNLLSQNDTTDFTFTVEAYSPQYPIIKTEKTFTITVLQEYGIPTDTLYIKATTSLQDRQIINSLLTNEDLIPSSWLYRPDDVYFGKANDVIYEHAYGIHASDIEEYIAAVTRNHYWRNITLGELKTAVAKDENGRVIYEVVYSEVIDNLNNPEGISVSESVYWPQPINLFLGPWYTSIVDIYTSYEYVLSQQYYTSLTSGYARTLYPNSLYNMRTRVANILGQEYDSRLLPAWMTSQQPATPANLVNGTAGSTLGYTPAWVICYVKPLILVDNTFYDYPSFEANKFDRSNYSSLAEIIKGNIENNWKQPDGLPYALNMINFKIDRFSVNKSLSYNYDKNVNPAVWTGLPSATPTPNPLDSKDFYVLFPHETILPNKTEQ